ncbi:MAG: hypothetical protein ACXVYS_07410 [Oryzihumus sp.]
MSQQPPNPPQPGPSEPTQSLPPQPTQPLPPAQPQAAQPGPVPSAAAAGAPPQGPPPVQPAPAGVGGRPPSAWQRATATSGRRWGLAAVAAVVAVLLLGGFAVGGFLVGRTVAFGNGGGRHGVMMGPRGNGPFADRGDGNGNDQRRRLMPGMPGGRLPGLGAGHGEYSAQGRTLVFQTGQVTAVSGTSITLRSTDGFSQSYTINSTTRMRGMQVAATRTGDTAFVLADKSTRVASLVALVSTQGSGSTG